MVKRNDLTTKLALAALYDLARIHGTNIDRAAIVHLAGDLGYTLKELAKTSRSL